MISTDTTPRKVQQRQRPGYENIYLGTGTMYLIWKKQLWCTMVKKKTNYNSTRFLLPLVEIIFQMRENVS